MPWLQPDLISLGHVRYRCTTLILYIAITTTWPDSIRSCTLHMHRVSTWYRDKCIKCISLLIVSTGISGVISKDACTIDKSSWLGVGTFSSRRPHYKIFKTLADRWSSRKCKMIFIEKHSREMSSSWFKIDKKRLERITSIFSMFLRLGLIWWYPGETRFDMEKGMY